MKQLEESIKNHQALVDIINSYSNEKGICHLSQTEIAQKLNKSPSWVSQAIQRLNREQVCIVKNKKGYSANFDNITTQGTFFEIIQTIHYFSIHSEKFDSDENEIAKELNIQKKTIQAAKAYLRDDFRLR